MKGYIRLVCCTVGLALLVAISALGALLMKPDEWFSGLEGMFVQEKSHSVHWLFAYGGLAVLFGGFLYEKENRRYCVLPLVLALLGVLWCLVFFRLHSYAFSLAVMVGMTAIACFVFIKSLRYRILPYLAAFVFSWYIYLFTVFLFVFCKNGT